MDAQFQEIIKEAESSPVLVRIMQAFERMLLNFNKKLDEKDEKISELEEKLLVFEKGYFNDMTLVRNELDDLNERMLGTEMYTSKDSIIVNNPPECQNNDLLGSMLNFLNSKLQAGLAPCDIKACHYLGKPGKSSVILKFVYFAQKNFVWRSKKNLKGTINQRNGYPI